MDYAKESLKMHYELKGKIEVVSRAKVDSKDALSLAYTPGVAQPCLEIQKDINSSILVLIISRLCWQLMIYLSRIKIRSLRIWYI